MSFIIMPIRDFIGNPIECGKFCVVSRGNIRPKLGIVKAIEGIVNPTKDIAIWVAYLSNGMKGWRLKPSQIVMVNPNAIYKQVDMDALIKHYQVYREKEDRKNGKTQ